MSEVVALPAIEESDLGLFDRVREMGRDALELVQSGADLVQSGAEWLAKKSRIGVYAATGALALGGVEVYQAFVNTSVASAKTVTIHKQSSLGMQSVLNGLEKDLPYNDYSLAHVFGHFTPIPPTKAWLYPDFGGFEASCTGVASNPGGWAKSAFKYLQIQPNGVSETWCPNEIDTPDLPAGLHSTTNEFQRKLNVAGGQILHSVKLRSADTTGGINGTLSKIVATYQTPASATNANTSKNPNNVNVTKVVLSPKNEKVDGKIRQYTEATITENVS